MLIAEGRSNKEIAQRLHLATNTVKCHVHNILEKLALHNRLQIAAHAHRAAGVNTASADRFLTRAAPGWTFHLVTPGFSPH